MPALVPQEDVVALAHEMAAADQTMREILDETLDSGENGEMTESGRTACGDATDLREPFRRWAESVELQSCPRGLIGVWHSHVSQTQLRNPEHSLPDQANVAFGHADVSIVVGTQSAEVLVGAADREDMADTFRAVLGLDVTETREVFDAIETGLIRDPPAARQRVRTAWEQLVYREQTGYRDLDARVDQIEAVPAAEPATVACHLHASGGEQRAGDTEGRGDGDAPDDVAAALEERQHTHGERAGVSAPMWAGTTAPDRLRRQARAGGDLIRNLTGDLTLREEIIGSAIGIVAGRVVERALFGE